MLYNSELFEKNVGLLDFAIFDIDLTLNVAVSKYVVFRKYWDSKVVGNGVTWRRQ